MSGAMSGFNWCMYAVIHISHKQKTAQVVRMAAILGGGGRGARGGEFAHVLRPRYRGLDRRALGDRGGARGGEGARGPCRCAAAKTPGGSMAPGRSPTPRGRRHGRKARTNLQFSRLSVPKRVATPVKMQPRIEMAMKMAVPVPMTPDMVVQGRRTQGTAKRIRLGAGGARVLREAARSSD